MSANAMASEMRNPAEAISPPLLLSYIAERVLGLPKSY